MASATNLPEEMPAEELATVLALVGDDPEDQEWAKQSWREFVAAQPEIDRLVAERKEIDAQAKRADNLASMVEFKGAIALFAELSEDELKKRVDALSEDKRATFDRIQDHFGAVKALALCTCGD